MQPTDADYLLDELDSCDCWCGRTPEECEEAGGCRWTRELAEARHQERVAAAEKLVAIAENYRDALTGPRASFRRGLEAAARHILPTPTPREVAGAIADGTAFVMRCPALDEETAGGDQ